LAAAHVLYEIENLLFTKFAKTYYSQDLQHKVLSKHKTFAAHSLGNTAIEETHKLCWRSAIRPPLFWTYVAYRYQQSLSRCITRQDVCIQ